MPGARNTSSWHNGASFLNIGRETKANEDDRKRCTTNVSQVGFLRFTTAGISRIRMTGHVSALPL